MCTAVRMHEGGIYTTDADIQLLHNPPNTKQSVMICPILKRLADCARPGPSRLSFTPKPGPKQCVGELEIPGLPSTARTLFSGLRVSIHRRVHWWGLPLCRTTAGEFYLRPARGDDSIEEYEYVEIHPTTGTNLNNSVGGIVITVQSLDSFTHPSLTIY